MFKFQLFAQEPLLPPAQEDLSPSAPPLEPWEAVSLFFFGIVCVCVCFRSRSLEFAVLLTGGVCIDR